MFNPPKTRTVMVKCVVVDSDGTPVDRYGNTTSRPWHVWEKKRMSMSWIHSHEQGKYWKEIKR